MVLISCACDLVESERIRIELWKRRKEMKREADKRVRPYLFLKHTRTVDTVSGVGPLRLEGQLIKTDKGEKGASCI